MGMLEQIRENHQLILFYIMMNHLTPLYLSYLVPLSVSAVSSYNLRNLNNLQTVDARTNIYYHSFLPSAMRGRNNFLLKRDYLIL